jgi:hypothetical protein
LSSPQGNAFYLLSLAKIQSKKMGLVFEDIKKEMTASDYKNLVAVFEKYFGDYYRLIEQP